MRFAMVLAGMSLFTAEAFPTGNPEVRPEVRKIRFQLIRPLELSRDKLAEGTRVTCMLLWNSSSEVAAKAIPVLVALQEQYARYDLKIVTFHRGSDWQRAQAILAVRGAGNLENYALEHSSEESDDTTIIIISELGNLQLHVNSEADADLSKDIRTLLKK